MIEKPYFQQTEAQRLRAWILTEMLRGAGKTAIVLVGIGVLLYVTYLFSLLLPPESKTAPDPILRGAIEAPLHPHAIV